MKQILMMIGQNLLKQLIAPSGSGSSSEGILEPVKEYVEDSVRHYAVVTAVAFLFSLYFVAGTLIMVTAAAESFDAFGFFAPGTFFWSGVAITVIAAAALFGCYAYLKHGRSHRTFHHHHEEHVHHADQLPVPSLPANPLGEMNFAHIAESVITGLISGFISGRVARHSGEEDLRKRIRRVL